MEPPPSGQLRWGDDVLWYQGSLAFRGKLIGFWADGRVRVRNADDQTTYDLPSRDALRRAEPSAPLRSIWDTLPPAALAAQPEDDVLERFRAMLAIEMPPGISIEAFCSEIWARGFEVFLAAGTVRDVLVGTSPRVIDIVTGMPLERVTSLARNMFDDPLHDPTREDSPIGSDSAGSVPRVIIGSSDWYSGIQLTVRNPCATDPDLTPLFGEDWERDACLRDFTCNTALFDPIQGLLIDPTGQAVSHIDERLLHPTSEAFNRTPRFVGWMTIRTVRFIGGGFAASDDLQQELRARAHSALASLGKAELLEHFATEVLFSAEERDWEDRMDLARRTFEGYEAAEFYDNVIHPARDRLMETIREVS